MRNIKIDGAIFDLDGTLLDSMPVWESIGEEYLLNCGLKPRDDLSERLRVMNLRQADMHFRLEYGLTDGVETIEKDISRMLESYYFNRVRPKEGVQDFLAELGRRNVKMCVATATSLNLAEAALRRCGLFHYFLNIFTCASNECGKDEPTLYAEALSFLATPKETTWVFEDALYAVRTAKTAGFNVIGVFDRSEPDTNTVQILSDVFIRSFSDIKHLLI